MSGRGRPRSGTSPGARRVRVEGAPAARRPRQTRATTPTASTQRTETRPEPSAGAMPVGGASIGHGRSASGRARPTRVGAPRTPQPERTFLGLSTARAVILAAVVCGLTLSLTVPLRTYFTQRAEAERMSAEQVRLEGELEQLRQQKEQLADPAYIRAQARERLRFVMPGETPYQVQLPGAYQELEKTESKQLPSTGAWYSDLWQAVSKPRPEPEPAPARMPVVPPPAPAEPGGPNG